MKGKRNGQLRKGQEIKIKRKGAHHNALDDAESQALHLIEIFNSFDSRDLPAL